MTALYEASPCAEKLTTIERASDIEVAGILSGLLLLVGLVKKGNDIKILAPEFAEKYTQLEGKLKFNQFLGGNSLHPVDLYFEWIIRLTKDFDKTLKPTEHKNVLRLSEYLSSLPI